MEEAAIIEQLTLFGLSRQEAAIYLCLLKNEELTGYEVAKLTIYYNLKKDITTKEGR